MNFLSFCGITGCGSASLKQCVSNAASPWSQSPSLDSQCNKHFFLPKGQKKPQQKPSAGARSRSA